VKSADQQNRRDEYQFDGKRASKRTLPKNCLPQFSQTYAAGHEVHNPGDHKDAKANPTDPAKSKRGETDQS
jgi:hypothetical protein